MIHRWGMADTPKRRLLDQMGGVPTYVAAGSRITGDVEAPGALVMCGQVRGDGDVKGPLSVAAGARWDGEVHARSGVIAVMLQMMCLPTRVRSMRMPGSWKVISVSGLPPRIL